MALGGGVEGLVSTAEAHPAVLLLDRHGRSLLRLARRLSLCQADAEDALQRATLILLTKGPAYPPNRLAAWMRVVTSREALAVRRERQRDLAGELREAWLGEMPCAAERFDRRERSLERMRLLAGLKPDERRALVLRGHGYSYREISELTGWTYTKVNRCLAEGRARLRALGALR